MSTRLIIERKGTGLCWEVVAHPRNDIVEAKETLEWLRREENKRRYKGNLRLVRETREILY